MVLKDGESGAYHFYTEHTRVITASVHQFVDTKTKPDGWPGDNYPKSMWAVCQNDRMFRLRDDAGKILDAFEDGYGDCYIHKILAGKAGKYTKDASRPAIQTFGLAVEREAVFEGSSIVGFRDATVEFKDAAGKTWTIPKFVIFSQKYSNFWHPIKATTYLAPHSILDKDFVISRKENDYTPGVAGSTPDLKPGTKAWEKYDEALKLIGFDLGQYLLDHASADHYARFFVEGVDPSDGYGRKGGEDEETAQGTGAQADTPPTQPEVDQEALEGLRATLKNRGAKK